VSDAQCLRVTYWYADIELENGTIATFAFRADKRPLDSEALARARMVVLTPHLQPKRVVRIERRELYAGTSRLV
jgi:hypothetical protein